MHELWNKENTCWKVSKVNEIYSSYIGDQICILPFFPNGPDDSLIWFQKPHGYYSSKTPYSWLILKKVGMGPHRFFWRTIWKLKTLLKIRMFTWRLGHDLLLLKDEIAPMRQLADRECFRYGEKRQTLVHALKDCPNARVVLTAGGVDGRLIHNDFGCCMIGWKKQWGS